MAAALQVRLLLWKDYLIRKRKPITLSGVAWATLVMLCLYAVRINVDNTDYPTCQFAARALPSAGMLNFLQSFICSVNNNCSEFDKFEEIPNYEKSSFSKLKRELSPLLGEADTPVAASTLLHAARLLSTLANVADNPVLLNITRHGLYVSDLFKNPKRAKRYLSKQLDVSEDVSDSILMAEVGINGIFKGDIDRCKIDSITNIIKINNTEHLKIFVEKLCSLSKKNVENLVVDLIIQVDLGKYVKMLGDMYSKLSGDTSFVKLGDMVSAVLRMMAPGSFVPRELAADDEFSYVNMTMLTKIMDLFEPSFGETESFKSIKEVVDAAVLGSQYLNKFIESDDNSDSTDTAASSISNMMSFDKIKQIYKKIVDAVSDANSNDVCDSFFNILSRIINFVFKWLPDNQKHDILFYSTLLAKLMEGSEKVININANIEIVALNVSLRNPKGVKLLLSLPPSVVGTGLEALADAERTQILTSKLNDPGQIFCDINGIKNIFLVSNDEAEKLKSQLCNDVWKGYIKDLVSSFGIYDVKENINSMASLFVLKTIGKDISNQLYSIDKDINIVKSFIGTVKNIDGQERVHVDWATAFNISKNSELLKIFKSKERLGKHMLLTVHGALAKEVVRQNPLLEYKISSFLKDIAHMIDAMNRQLDLAPRELQRMAKKLYPDIVQTLLATAVDEDKTYQILSTPCADVLCKGQDNAGVYLNFPLNINREELVPVMCNITLAIEEGLTKDSIVGKVIDEIKNSKHTILDEINWTQLITDLNKLYAKLYEDYTYLFDKTFKMDEALQKKVFKEIEEIKEFWFNFRNINRAIHLGIKLGFRLLDLLDYSIFDISDSMWRELKLRLNSAIGPIIVVHEVLQVIGGHTTTFKNDSLPVPAADALSALVVGLPRLITDATDLIIRDDTDIQPILSLLNAADPWPCVSITTALDLSPLSIQTVQAIEKLMCFEAGLQQEWSTYLEEKKVYPENWNTTELPKNVFLKFSAAFDSLVKDLDIINELFNHAFEESEDGSINFASAIRYAINAFNNTNKNETLIKFLSKVDTVLSSINTSSIQDTVALNILWKDYLKCSQSRRDGVVDDKCKTLGRSTWKNTLKFISVAFENFTEDFSTYLKESREQNATILQKLGFTRKTGLYMLYDKFSDYLTVLINSYFDYGFMSKVRRASESQFWDCEELVGALVPAAPDIPALDRQRRDLLCPSLLYWVSMPRGANTLVDLLTKPQYLFFTMEVSSLTSEFEKAYKSFNELTILLSNITFSDTSLTDDINIGKFRENLVQAVDRVLSYRIKDTEPSYQKFSESNKKQYASMIYLTRVVTMINKLTTALNNFNNSDIDSKTLEAELPIIQKAFQRRPSEVISFHFDLITDVLWTNDSSYRMVEALTNACDRLKNKDKSKDILVELDRVKTQMCAKQYTSLYGVLQNVVDEDLEAARNSLMNVVVVVGVMESDAVNDISVFFNKRKALVDFLKRSVNYAYDLGTPIYLKYLQSNLKHYDIILSFLTGNNWWEELRKLYNGPQARDFFDTVEQVFGISEDILTHLDKIHLVKLLRDVNVNSTEALCRVSLSEYSPDGSGALSSLLARACFGNRTLLMQELPPLLFASQGLDDDLKISDDIDYIALYSDMSNTETKLEQIKDGPKSPSRPTWITEEKLKRFRTVAVNLLSKESLIEISFGIFSNVVDAGTLFLNNSQCMLCSSLTSWLKQLNLQLYKRQEYDSLLCALDAMKLDEIHTTLRSNFHWDMAITELISTRNYTKYELNKSLNELLEQVKLHLLDDVSSNSTKLFQCLANNVTRNMFGNAALFTKVLSRTTKLIRAMLPHLQEIPGITDLSYFKQMFIHIAHKLHANDTLSKYINDKKFSKKIMEVVKHKELVQEIEMADVDLFMIKDGKSSKDSIFIKNIGWDEICKNYDCDKIISIINTYINRTLAKENLLTLQKSEFWKFKFISNIIQHMEVLVEHLAGVVGGVSEIDVSGVKEGRMMAVLDAVLTLLRDDVMNPLEYSVRGVVKELEPLLYGTALEFDVTAVTDGLKILRQFKTFLIQQGYKMRVSAFFPESYQIETSLNALGINNTNFWSVAAPRIQAGQIGIESVLAHRGSIRDFVCDIDTMSLALFPGSMEPVSLDDVLGAVVEQFCDINDDLARDILRVIIENANYSEILNVIKTELLSQLFKASNLTQSEGNVVLSKLSEIGTYLPEMRQSVEKIGNTLANEPLIARLKSGSVGEVLGSSEFFSEAGNMMCGTPMQVELGRIYRSVARAPDQKAEPDQKQLDALPTDYCRSLYKDIINMEGGKILWSFVKPLVMGKILYTPPNPTVTKIVEKAKATFAPMIRLMDMVHEFSSSFPHILNLTTHRDGLKALQNLVTLPRFRELRESLIGNVSAPDVDIDQIFDQLGDVESLGSLLSRASSLLRCVSTQRFAPAASEHDLALEAARLTMINEFSAGLVFMDVRESNHFPSNISYKIRMDIENSPTTKRLKNYFWTPGPEGSFLENMRYFRGFVQIQDIIDKAIIELSIENAGDIQKREIKEKSDWAIYTQQLPYPCYRRDFFQTSLYESQSLIVGFFFSLLFSVCSAVRFIVKDKETGNTMLMSVMGVDLRCHTLSWFVSSFLELVLTMCCVCLVLCGGRVLPRTDPGLVMTMLLLYSFSVLSFCYMMSKMFSGAGSAAVVSGLAYLLSFMPFVLILSLEAVMTSSLKLFVSLSMSSSLCYGFLFITRLEATGTGAGWAQLWETPEGSTGMSIGIAGLMVLADGVLYLIIGLVLDKFFGIKTTSNITILQASDEKAGVSIVNVSKEYSAGARALDGVCMELQRGQITTLLGHNGAGKTTLIKVLTGMLKPTKGHVIVRTEGDEGARLGVCPQHDVLFEQLSAREHVQLYAQLKSGRALAHVRDEVQSMLSVLSLGAVAARPVSQLSGGTRRRLCVALAFVGRPALVSLDEPTAGVDPAARRDIWSMIMKLRENRTILMTTHHLDEAELLSDQIIIMHKGQIHTTGSPIEIKRTLGTGYKLTVTYPEKTLPEEELEDVGIEEKTKNLLTVVRNVIKNANLVDVNSSEVEINLPFYDSNGVSNDLQGACEALESAQGAGRRQVALDCSSLEQVFHDLCRRADSEPQATDCDVLSLPESSTSVSGSSKEDLTPLVNLEGPLKGTLSQQFSALMYARYLHYTRNKWLVLILIVLPSLFLAAAMAFSSIRPPADIEVSLALDSQLYEPSTRFTIKQPSIYSKNIDPSFSRNVLDTLQLERKCKNWTSEDSPSCKCVNAIQQCDIQAGQQWDLPETMLLPDVTTLNNWLVDSQQIYIEKRYGGFTATLRNNLTYLVAWYNNKGHHALPVYINALNSGILKTVTGDPNAAITVYTHPLKISTEQLNKDNVYQHIADAGISGMLLIAYSLAGAGGAALAVAARVGRQKRLQLLCGTPPALLAALQLLWDMMVIGINMVITAIILEIFQFPVFVARNNLPAICILILLYGYACSGLVSVFEKLFQDPSLATMLLFCGNAFAGLVGIALLIILDVISDSDATDHARYVLHKLLLLCPQFALGDGLLEIAKNTIQAQVLSQFGMDTYRDPLRSDVVFLHYGYLLAVGTALHVTNLLIEYHCFEALLNILNREHDEAEVDLTNEWRGGCSASDTGVAEEAARVMRALAPVTLRTVGNINAGFVDTEGIAKPRAAEPADVCAALRLRRRYGRHVALRGLTLGLPPGQCTVLLGENGAGKSTAFSILTGELRPTSGELYLQGRRVTPRDLCQGLISYCPQSDAVDPLLTVNETLEIYCRLRGIENPKKVAGRAMAAFELRAHGAKPAGALSGGMRRKLCTALAAAARAPLLLLDEPTSGMDPLSRACVWRAVRAACEPGRAALLSTHALDDARRLARRVALLRTGELCAVAPLQHCLQHFGGGYVVSCRVRGSPAGAWRRVQGAAPRAVLRVMLPTALHFLLPLQASVDGKESLLKLSDIFRLMSELQKSCDIEDYTVNQSSLDQMFLSFTEKTSIVDLEEEPKRRRRSTEEEDSVTAL